MGGVGSVASGWGHDGGRTSAVRHSEAKRQPCLRASAFVPLVPARSAASDDEPAMNGAGARSGQSHVWLSAASPTAGACPLL